MANSNPVLKKSLVGKDYTLRDKIAIAAMQAQITNPDRLKQLAQSAQIAVGNPDHREEQIFTWIAEASYKAADAMLKAREK